MENLLLKEIKANSFEGKNFTVHCSPQFLEEFIRIEFEPTKFGQLAMKDEKGNFVEPTIDNCKDYDSLLGNHYKFITDFNQGYKIEKNG